jgi:type I restriction enzyme, S subunit
MSSIPSHWGKKKLKYVASLKSGDTITSDSITESGEYPVFGGNGIRGYTSAYTHCGKYVLIGRQGALCGNINYASGCFWASEHAVVVDIKGEDEVRWLGELLRSMDLNQYSQSAAQPGISVDVIANLEIPVPPLLEQRAIADYLDRETARLDGLVAAKERVLRLLAEKRRALITRAVTRGLDPHAPMKDTGVEWLPRVPRHWIPTKISRLFRQAKRLGFADLTVLSVYRDYGVIERATRDDNANRVPDDLEKYQLVEPGDLVINKMKAWQGSLGISELNGITSPDYVVFCPLHCEAPPFLHYLLRNQLLTTVYLSMSNGIRTSQWRLEPDRFGTLVLFLPPLVEQHAIVAHITTETAKLDALRSATERTIALLKERRAALIAAAVTGKLDGQGVERHIAVVAN